MSHRARFAVLLAGLVATAFPTVAAGAGEVPIRHVVVMMQEDRTFDHYFGTYPGVEGWPDGYALPVDPDDPAAGSVAPFELEATRTPSLPHGAAAMRDAYRGGRNDGFVAAAERHGAGDGRLALGYYDADAIPGYWRLAADYVIADHWFSSVMGPSFPNHLYAYAASMTGPDGTPYSSVPAEGMELATIFDRLHEAGVSWKVYIQGYDPDATFRNTEARLGLTDSSAQLVWVPLLGIPRFVDDPELNSRLVPLAEYYDDLAAGTLPEVAFITPSGLSEHPPGDLTLGHYFAIDVIEALMSSDAWWSSAFFLTWDEWGGWADHLPPPQVDQFGYGMRVPGLIISPYAKQGHIDSTVYDHTSPLAFISHLFDLEPLAPRDAAADPMLSAFDFSQPPRAPLLPTVTPAPAAGATGREEASRALWWWYAATLAGATGVAALVGASALLRRRVPRAEVVA